MVSEKPNTGLHTYSEGETWFDGTDDDPPGHNDIADYLEESLIIRLDTEANRTNYTAYNGLVYWPTDSNQLYEGDGTSWNALIDLDASGLSNDSVGTEHIDPTGGSAGQVLGLDSNGDPTWKDDQTSDAGTTSIADELGTNGNVVWIGENANGTFDPSSTNTPVQDAINALEGLSNEFGTILLPAGTISEGGTLNNLQGKQIIGQGIGRDVSGQIGTTVEIGGSGHGILADSVNEVSWTYLDQFCLRSDDTSDGRSAIKFTNNEQPRFFNMGRMRFQDWTNTSAGAIWFDTGAAAFGVNWQYLVFFHVRGSGLHYDSQQLANTIGHMTYAPRSGNAGPNSAASEGAAITVNSNPRLDIGTINTDEHSNGILDASSSQANAAINIGFANHEPTQLSPQETDTPFVIGGGGTFQIWNIHNTLTEVPYIVEHQGGNAKAIIGDIRNNAGTVNNNFINVSGVPNVSSWYWGSSSSVTDNSGGDASNFRLLDSAGTGL